MNRYVAHACLISALALLAANPALGIEPSYDELLQQATQAGQRGDHRQAIERLTAAVKASPDTTPAGTILATATPTSSRTWRYLISAKSVSPSATLRFQQNGATLATIPILPASSNYIGTIAVTAAGPVTLTVIDGNAATDTILIYDAGAAS